MSWRDLLFWSTEIGTAVFWAALAIGVAGVFRDALAAAHRRWRHRSGGFEA